jgi:hypothetical protein
MLEFIEWSVNIYFDGFRWVVKVHELMTTKELFTYWQNLNKP